MSMAGYLLIGAALLCLLLALTLFLSSRSVDLSKRIRERFSMLYFDPLRPRAELSVWQRLCRRIDDISTRVGIRLGPKGLRLSVAALIAAILLTTVVYGLEEALVVLGVTVLLIYVLLQLRYRRRAEALLNQLPRFIDNLDRSLGAGRSLQAALVLASERSQEPLKSVLLRVKNNVELGGQLGEQLQSAANAMAVREFQLLALAVNVHQRYGGSIKALLHSITQMVQRREQARRELSALTGETRFSAWVLGVLPLLVAAYMSAVNPGYLQSMLASDDGRLALYAALGLQIAGGFTLWRMVKTI